MLSVRTAVNSHNAGKGQLWAFNCQKKYIRARTTNWPDDSQLSWSLPGLLSFPADVQFPFLPPPAICSACCRPAEVSKIKGHHSLPQIFWGLCIILGTKSKFLLSPPGPGPALSLPPVQASFPAMFPLPHSFPAPPAGFQICPTCCHLGPVERSFLQLSWQNYYVFIQQIISLWNVSLYFWNVWEWLPNRNVW